MWSSPRVTDKRSAFKGVMENASCYTHINVSILGSVSKLKEATLG